MKLVHICSFVEKKGSAIVNGRNYRWEFHRWLGPTFLRADGRPLKHQPGERHPVWEAFQKWFDKHYPEE
jgi:hypothetical protein